MKRDGTGFLANSVANLLVGAAALGYVVIVPAIVVRRFGPAEYGMWYLAFQIAAYVLLLDLGSQYIVTNEAATYPSDERAPRLATAATVIQSALAVTVVGAGVVWAGLTGQTRLALLITIVGLAAIPSLLASTVRAWFVGLRRAHVPAVWLIAARGASLAGLALAVATHADLVTLTLAVAAPQLVVHVGFLMWARRPPSPWARPDRAAFVGICRRSVPLALWTVCAILITGVDLFVVRAVDPSEVGRYALALPLLAVPTGVVTAAITAWMPRLARVDGAAGDAGRDLTITATTAMAAALSVGAIPFTAYAGDLVRLFAGAGEWASTTRYVQLLYLGCSLRFLLLPWTILIVVRGRQGMITWAPVAEATVNVASSVILGLWLGASGVALGTLLGAVVGLTVNLAWAVPRTADRGVTPSGLVVAAGRAWLPVAATSAVVLLALVKADPLLRGLAVIVALAIDGWWISGWRTKTRTLLAQFQSSCS
jgi:O-antigen/teichoic acid export membrane protein